MRIEGVKPEITASESYLSIVVNSIGKLTLKIFDTNGRIAKKICEDIMSGVQQLEINLSDLAEGTYVFNAFNGDQFIKSFKVTKQ